MKPGRSRDTPFFYKGNSVQTEATTKMIRPASQLLVVQEHHLQSDSTDAIDTTTILPKNAGWVRMVATIN